MAPLATDHQQSKKAMVESYGTGGILHSNDTTTSMENYYAGNNNYRRQHALLADVEPLGDKRSCTQHNVGTATTAMDRCARERTWYHHKNFHGTDSDVAETAANQKVASCAAEPSKSTILWCNVAAAETT